EGDRGTLLGLTQASPDRIASICGHFTYCGGCALQHLAPDAYAAFKRGLLETPLRRAGIETPVAPLVYAQGAGRRRATLHATRAGAGFMAHRSHTLRALDACPVLVPALATATEIARAAQAMVGNCDVSLTATDTGLDVAVRPEKRADPRRLVPLGARFGLARISLGTDLVWQSRVPTIRMGRAVVELPAGSFLQATAAAEETLAGLVAAALPSAKHVLDLFCGVGPFALRLAERARVTALDSDRPSVAALQQAVRNTQGLKPVSVQARDLFRNPLAPAELTPFDAVVLDPPRAGAEAQVRELAGTRIKTLVYVSCDPQTFSRDAAILCGAGWRLESVTPVDQFAWSTHVETVGVFRR
ncbi:MAG TPA: methyltransferase domain-containing protein, partial [Thermoleophilaceae bacterium]|nr:methyltransferase domain-containing protein [Thermoleophilaceae bacterium]